MAKVRLILRRGARAPWRRPRRAARGQGWARTGRSLAGNAPWRRWRSREAAHARRGRRARRLRRGVPCAARTGTPRRQRPSWLSPNRPPAHRRPGSPGPAKRIRAAVTARWRPAPGRRRGIDTPRAAEAGPHATPPATRRRFPPPPGRRPARVLAPGGRGGHRRSRRERLSVQHVPAACWRVGQLDGLPGLEGQGAERGVNPALAPTGHLGFGFNEHNANTRSGDRSPSPRPAYTHR